MHLLSFLQNTSFTIFSTETYYLICFSLKPQLLVYFLEFITLKPKTLQYFVSHKNYLPTFFFLWQCWQTIAGFTVN